MYTYIHIYTYASDSRFGIFAFMYKWGMTESHMPCLIQVTLYATHRQLWWYEVATISRLPEKIGLFCKRALSKRWYSSKETCIFKEHTNQSHPTAVQAPMCSYTDEAWPIYMWHASFESCLINTSTALTIAVPALVSWHVTCLRCAGVCKCLRSMCCSVLQCVAMYCSVLQCVVVRCSVLQCVCVLCGEWIQPWAFAYAKIRARKRVCVRTCAIYGKKMISAYSTYTVRTSCVTWLIHTFLCGITHPYILVWHDSFIIDMCAYNTHKARMNGVVTLTCVTWLVRRVQNDPLVCEMTHSTWPFRVWHDAFDMCACTYNKSNNVWMSHVTH